MKSQYTILVLICCLLISLNIYSQKEKYNDFILHFCFDSVFQKERVLFPLEYIYWDYDDDKEKTSFIKENQYKYDPLFCNSDDDAYPLFYDNFDCRESISDEMVFRWKGYTDVDIRYFFKLIDSRWFLVKIMDYDASFLY